MSYQSNAVAEMVPILGSEIQSRATRGVLLFIFAHDFVVFWLLRSFFFWLTKATVVSVLSSFSSFFFYWSSR